MCVFRPVTARRNRARGIKVFSWGTFKRERAQDRDNIEELFNNGIQTTNLSREMKRRDATFH